MPSDDQKLSLPEFEDKQRTTFAPLLSVIDNFAHEQGLEVSHSFDLDPIDTHACYFCTWLDRIPEWRFIRICATHPFINSTEFYIDAERRKFHKRWIYRVEDGPDSLRDILQSARLALDQ